METQSPLIMVVDDDVDFLEWGRCVLQAEGYGVDCRSSCEAALEEMAARAPDLLITDLMMGSLHSGFFFAEQVKADARLSHVPIMIVTAAESQCGFDFRPRSADDLTAMHADAFLCKPVDPKQFLAKVKALLGARRASARRGGAAPSGEEAP